MTNREVELVNNKAARNYTHKKTIGAFALVWIGVVIVIVFYIATAAAVTADVDWNAIDWNSDNVYTEDADSVDLPRGTWCLIASIRNNYGEPRTLIYLREGARGLRGCDPENQIVVEPKKEDAR